MQFGTSGLRGLVTDLTDPVCAAYTDAFLHYLAGSGKPCDAMLIGRDRRPSSPRMAQACAAAAQRAGTDTVDCGVLPTPALALEAARRGLPAIMVTGSHIPFDRNGLKFYHPGGSEITKACEAAITAGLRDIEIVVPAAPSQPPDESAATQYTARLRAFFGPGALKDMRIGLWEHSAAGRDLTAAVLTELGAEVIRLDRTDAFVPIDTEAVAPGDAARVADWVAQHGLDALVSTDGDGDRPLMADERGRIMRGDLLGLLTAAELGADAVATPLSSSTALERSGWIDKVVRTRIGSPYVIEGMTALAAAGAHLPVGYEANGGFLLGGTAVGSHGATLAALPTRDALLPMLAVLTAARRRGITLGALADTAPRRMTASDRLTEIARSTSDTLLAALEDDATFRMQLLGMDSPEQPAAIDTLDGVRMTLTSGDIVHLRASGNAPELRIYAESGEAADAMGLAERTKTAIQRHLYTRKNP
jgi:phosphomannomutase